MYRRAPTTRNKLATAARIPMIHNLRPSMTSGMVFAARTCGAAAAAIKSPAAETMLCAYMGGLHKGFVRPPRWEPHAVLAGGGAPPYVGCEGWWSVRHTGSRPAARGSRPTEAGTPSAACTAQTCAVSPYEPPVRLTRPDQI